MALIFSNTAIAGLTLITPHQIREERGCFCKYFSKKNFEENSLPSDFSEFSVNMSYKKGTLRGMPYQHNPSQARLVYVITGSIFDVALDLRQNSNTFGKYECFYLSANSYQAVFIPGDFAHGCLSLEDNTIICEQFTGDYIPENSGRIIWNDKELNIPWPINALNVPLIISEKDNDSQTFVQYRKRYNLAEKIVVNEK
jgi:dTDP-4-dehydrorhamnose 3,5-epimerase